MEFANERFKEKLIHYVTYKYTDPEDLIVSKPHIFIKYTQTLDDTAAYLKQNFGELQRKPERDLVKQVAWHFDKIVAEVTGTNIQRTIFRKRDFIAELHQEHIESGGKKREVKGAEKDWEAENETHGLEPGQKLVSYKTTNSMNNMLPSVKDAHVEASEKRKQEEEDKEKENLLQKRQKIDGLKKFYEQEKQSVQMNETLDKMLVHSKVDYSQVGGMKDTVK